MRESTRDAPHTCPCGPLPGQGRIRSLDCPTLHSPGPDPIRGAARRFRRLFGRQADRSSRTSRSARRGRGIPVHWPPHPEFHGPSRSDRQSTEDRSEGTPPERRTTHGSVRARSALLAASRPQGTPPKAVRATTKGIPQESDRLVRIWSLGGRVATCFLRPRSSPYALSPPSPHRLPPPVPAVFPLPRR